MPLFEQLNKELVRDGEGAFAPYYYRCLGYRRQLSARPPFLRANGICGLFTET